MAYTIGINKNMGQMFEDLETLMLQEGWEKLSRNTIGSFTTSRGYKYTAAGNPEAYPGRYSDTTAISFQPTSSFVHSSVSGTPSDTFYNDYPTEFSISFWVNFSNTKTHLSVTPQANTIFFPKFINQFTTSGTSRTSPSLVLDRDGAVGEEAGPMGGLLYYMNKYFTHKDGNGWELFTLTYSNLEKKICFYINNTLVYETPFPLSKSTWTFYGAIYALTAGEQSKIIDELIVWNKKLLPEEVSSLYSRTSSVPIDFPGVFEKYTSDISVLSGGTYQNVDSGGVRILISILYNTYNNIEFRTPTIFASPLNFIEDCYITNMIGQEASPRCLAGVSASSSILKKYWLVVNNNRVIVAYKLQDSSASRTTPLYQLGYIGKIKALGNDGFSIFSAGTTNTNNYLWTSVNAISFRSGVMYSPNNAHRLGYSGYLNVAVGSINTSLSSLFSISNSSFLAGINVSYSTISLGSLDSVYAVSNNQASPEDLITVNSVDYVVLPDGDVPTGSYYLALKLQ